jgi:hypothetical protein
MQFRERYKAKGNVVVKTGTSLGDAITFIFNYDKIHREVVLVSGKKFNVRPLSYVIVKNSSSSHKEFS